MPIPPEPQIVFDNRKNARIARFFLLLFLFILAVVLSEGARAGFTAYFRGYTPQLLGLVPTSPLKGGAALAVGIGTAAFGLLFIFLFLQQMIRGNVDRLVVENGQLVQHWNGSQRLVRRFELGRMQSIQTKQEHSNHDGYQSVSAKVSFQYPDESGKMRKRFMMRSTKPRTSKAMKAFRSARRAWRDYQKELKNAD